MHYENYNVVYGIIGSILFLYKNPNKNYRITIAILIFLVLLSETIYVQLNDLFGQILWVGSASALLIFYSLRFWRKEKLEFIDFLKFLSILLIVTFPFPFYTFFTIKSVLVLVSFELAIPIICAIYFYDRFILKPQPMKKKFVFILLAQTLLILLTLTYAIVQQGIAQENARLAEENARKAVEQAKFADESARRALDNEVKYNKAMVELQKIKSPH